MAHKNMIARVLVSAALFAVAMAASLVAKADHTTFHTGQTVWQNVCSGCHYTDSGLPEWPRFNAAGNSRTALDYVISQEPQMQYLDDAPASGGLTTTERDAVAQYIRDNRPTATATTTFGQSVTVDVGNVIYVGGHAFSSVQTVSGPTGGSLGTWSGTQILYTPAGVGTFTFTYRGIGGVTGFTHTASITVNKADQTISFTQPSAQTYSPGGTFSLTASASSGLAVTFTSNTTGVCTVSSNTVTIVSGGTCTITASQAGNTNYNAAPSVQRSITINPASQTITFNQPAAQTYSPGGTFSAPASSTSGLTVAVTSGTLSVCTVSGNTVTIQSAGTCTLNANQAGNASYSAASQVTRNVSIGQATQSITFGAQASPRTYSQGGSFAISPVATASSGLAVSYSSTTGTVCSVAGTNVSMLTAGTCTIAANQSGNTNYTAATQVTQSVVINGTVPGAPTIGTATRGNNSAIVAFTAPTNNGGSTITQYTATCSAGGQPTRSNTGTVSPITVTLLTNEVLYTCSVTATNATGTSAASGTVTVTPTPDPVAPAFTSADNTTFTVTQAGTFTATASGYPDPAFTHTAGALPTGVTFTAGTISGTPALGTVGNYPITLRATNSQGFVNQSFTLTVARTSQSISFTGPGDRQFGLATVPVSATASSGLTVAFSSTTPLVCSVSGTSVTMVSVGTCTIAANQAGDANYTAAPQVTQSFVISKGDQSITFGAQASPQSFSLTPFAINPQATASSGLAVTYSSSTPAVCSVSGTSVTPQSLGTCTIVADQAGNANWNSATSQQQSVTIVQGPQAITFNNPGTLAYLNSGTHTLVATASSGLTVAFTSSTPSVCTVAADALTTVAAGTCTIAANQAGNTNFQAAPQVTRSFTIGASLPGAPTIGTTVSNGGAITVSFTPPTNTGGTTLTGFVATCNGITATGSASPVAVTGLANGISHSCSVQAMNSAGTGPASGTVTATPGTRAPTIWAGTCSSCHAGDPSGARFNAAGTTTAVLSNAIATVPDMLATPGVQSLTQLDRKDLVDYITSYLQPVEITAAPNTAKPVSLAQHLTLGSFSFTHVEVLVPPAHGTLSAFTGTAATYTPTGGYTGADSFTYRGVHTNGLVGDPFVATIQVDPAARVFTLTLSGPTNSGVVLLTDLTGTRICSTSCSDAYANNSTVELMAAPEAGYIFTGWSGACSGTGTCLVTMNADKAVTATFILATQGLAVTRAGTGAGTVTSAPAGIDCGAACSFAFAENSSVTLTATPSVGSAFAGWSGACAGTGACTVTMDQARSVTATFEQLSYSVTVTRAGTGSGSVSSAPGGITCGATCSATYVHGTSVTLTATPAAGNTFTGWSGACSGSGTGTCTVTVDQARAVTATFTPIVHTLSVSRSGAGSGSVSSSPLGIDCGATCSAGFNEGTVVTLFAAPTTSSTFGGWTGACSGLGTCTVTISAARSVGAVFNPIPGTLTTSVGSIDFGTQSMGTVSASRTVTITNPGPNPVNPTGVTSTDASFVTSHNCTATLAVGASCTVSIAFAPAPQPGLVGVTIGLGATVNVAHDGQGGAAAVTVYGVAEKALVTYYYQSILGRLPDAGGLAYWQAEVSRLGTLGISPNEGWYAMAAAFFNSAEYQALGRDDAGFVTDLYETFLGRAPDAGGLAFWVDRLARGMPEDVVMTSFMFSAEFAAFSQGIFGNTAARAEVDMVVDFYRGLLARTPDTQGFQHWVQRFRAAQCQGATAVYSEVEAISSAFANSAEYVARNRDNAEYVADMYNTFMRRGGDLSGVAHWVAELDAKPFTRNEVRRAFIASPEFSARVAAVIAQGCQ